MKNHERKHKAINLAKEYLRANRFDVLHDEYHHYVVWKNCIEIIYSEEPDCNKEFVEVAAWWHDTSKAEINNTKEEEYSHIEENLGNACYSSEEIRQIIEIIKGHSVGKNQTSIEAKILYDADKLEYLSPARFYISQEFLPMEVRLKYEDKWYKWVPKIYGTLNFEYSKSVYRNNLETAKSIGRILFLDPSKAEVSI